MDGHKVLLDVFTPEKEGGPWPVVVWIHGGGWRRGDKEGCPHMELVKQGFCAAVSINYCLTDVAPMPAQIEDCKAAIRFLRANATKYNLDPDRIGVYGGSAGGHLAALVGTSAGVKELETQGGNFEYSSRVQAVCDWYGPSDLTKMKGDVIESLLGGLPEEKKDLARLCSPLTHVSPDDPPFLIMHGDDDSTVPHDHSVWLAEALEEAGVAVEFVTVDTLKGVGHGFSTAAMPVSKLREKSLSFFIEQFVTKEEDSD
jgi:acetyl esterase/lipase